MGEFIASIPVNEYRSLVESETLLEVTRRVVRANRAGMPETLSDVLDVYLEKQVDLGSGRTVSENLSDLGYME